MMTVGGGPGHNTYMQCRECGGTRKVRRDAIESAVLAGLVDLLKHKDAIATFVDEYNKERRRLAARGLSADKASLTASVTV
jgi:hypothetical protein